MRNKMHFADNNSAALNVVITELPAIPIASENGEWVQLRGVDGERFVSDGSLASVPMTVKIWVHPRADVNAVTAWLTGAGHLRFNDWSWYWDARIDGAIELQPCTFNDGWTAAVPFKVKPHRYLWPEIKAITLTDIGDLYNPGTAESKPLITITGTGEVTLMIGTYSVLIDEMDGAITMDCESKIAYNGSGTAVMDQVSLVDGLWPVLNPGANMVNWSGDVSSVVFTPRWRYR